MKKPFDVYKVTQSGARLFFRTLQTDSSDVRKLSEEIKRLTKETIQKAEKREELASTDHQHRAPVWYC